jgi:hypothetical protein
MSKGSNQRPTDKNKFDEGWDRIFGRQKLELEERKSLSEIAPWHTEATKKNSEDEKRAGEKILGK